MFAAGLPGRLHTGQWYERCVAVMYSRPCTWLRQMLVCLCEVAGSVHTGDEGSASAHSSQHAHTEEVNTTGEADTRMEVHNVCLPDDRYAVVNYCFMKFVLGSRTWCMRYFRTGKICNSLSLPLFSPPLASSAYLVLRACKATR